MICVHYLESLVILPKSEFDDFCRWIYSARWLAAAGTEAGTAATRVMATRATGSKAAHMAPEGVTSLGVMTVKTKGCVITWGP